MHELLRPSPDFVVCASIADAAALITARNAAGQVTTGIRCQTAGTLVLTPAGAAATQAQPFLAGERLPVAVKTLTEAGSSGAVPITVFY